MTVYINLDAIVESINRARICRICHICPGAPGQGCQLEMLRQVGEGPGGLGD